MDTVASGAVQFLKALSDVTALTGSFDLSDPIAANAGQPWIFNVGITGENLVTVEGTGSSAIVCSGAGSFAGGTPGGTAQFDRLSVEFWVDVARDAYGNIAESTGGTYRRAHQLYLVADSHLHRREPGAAVLWGEALTVASWRLSAPVFYLVPDGEGLMRGQAFYAVTLWAHTSLAL